MTRPAFTRLIMTWALVGNMVALAFVVRSDDKPPDPGPFATLLVVGMLQAIVVVPWPLVLLDVILRKEDPKKASSCTVLVEGI